mmetsp:Transcript_19014/g.60817  ORF Transcript_19014/g.60817 Transcript_19014/m.60817 type:complete len:230 (+) Transcript_19014:607-1296(+)
MTASAARCAFAALRFPWCTASYSTSCSSCSSSRSPSAFCQATGILSRCWWSARLSILFCTGSQSSVRSSKTPSAATSMTCHLARTPLTCSARWCTSRTDGTSRAAPCCAPKCSRSGRTTSRARFAGHTLRQPWSVPSTPRAPRRPRTTAAARCRTLWLCPSRWTPSRPPSRTWPRSVSWSPSWTPRSATSRSSSPPSPSPSPRHVRPAALHSQRSRERYRPVPIRAMRC